MSVVLVAVTVNAVVPVLELASKNTLSTDVGAEAPALAPDDIAQFVVEVEFQVPVPPTQYLLAISYALATHLHVVVATFHTKPTSSLAVVTVVVGRALVNYECTASSYLIAYISCHYCTPAILPLASRRMVRGFCRCSITEPI